MLYFLEQITFINRLCHHCLRLTDYVGLGVGIASRTKELWRNIKTAAGWDT